MLKQSNLSLYFLLCVLFLLAACSNAGESPVIVVVEVSATPPITSSSPSENSIVIIVPPPLPTTLPDQQTRLEEASRSKVSSVDFVIDTTKLEIRSIPFRFKNGENWYKYTPPDEAYSVLLYGSGRPSWLVDFETVVLGNPVKFQGVYASGSTDLSYNQVISFLDPLLESGELTPEEYLELLENSLPDGVLSLTKIASVNIVNRSDIQLGNHSGRDFILEVIPNEGGNASFLARLRVYVVGNTVYQLYAADILEDAAVSNENTIRFLDSFTPREMEGEG